MFLFLKNFDAYMLVSYMDNNGDIQCNDSLLETYGLPEHQDDIMARVVDVEPYGYVRKTKLGEA